VTPLSRKFLARKLLPVLISAAALLLACFPAGAIIDATLQMQLGNPSNATSNPTNHNYYLILRTVEAIDYSDNLGQPNWASWDLTSADLGNSGRTDAWVADTNLPPGFYQVPINAFSGSAYDRGHMCPSADRTDTVADNELVFIMSNIIPQASLQNQNIWANFENYTRQSLLPGGKELLIICGPSLFTTNKLNNNHVTIPGYTWKIVVVVPSGAGTATNRISPTTQVIALRIPNTDTVAYDAWQDYRTNVVAVESDTGFTFFTALSSNLATVLRNKIDGQTPPAPAITGFSPASGIGSSSVVIMGTNLVFTTNVTFNGIVASFTINSTTNLTATVPTNANNGPIAVATLGGTFTTSSNFIVNSSAGVDLAVLKTHTANFTQGDTGDIYTIIVTNVGAAASTDTITVTDTLPAGLTATALGGSGWTADLGMLTCTRADTLLAGAAYPPITLTVNVSGSAPATVTNTAIVSGGGDTNATNNTATDPTTINAAAAPTATTGTASGVGTTVATLNGTVNPNGQSTTAQFEYGTNTSYGSTASVSATLTGTTAQAVSANLTGLAEATTYHFRLVTTNALGSTNGLDQTFATTTAGVPDLANTVTHTGNFTQGDTGDLYTIIVANVGTAASSGTVTVTNVLPAGLTATDISGTGWTPNLSALTCTRSNSLTAGTNYPPITVTVNVATNAPPSVTNIAVVVGGDETNLVNNTASDPTTINPSSGGGGTNTLVGWDMNALPGGLNNFGPSPMAPATNAANLTIVGLTRGSGIGTNANQAAARAWGGNTFTDTTSTAAIAANRFATFSLTANSGYKVSYTAISKFDYRHSPTGPTNGLLQYQIGSGAFADIAALSYPSNTSSGGSLSPIDLSGISALQNVAAGTNITFRIVNWGGTSSAGTWYIFDVASSIALDFVVQGTVSPVVAPAADLTISKSHTGNFTQGDTSDSYTITVTNIGAAATAGSVSVVDTLPAGLTPAAISGDGWSANLTNLTCTRADPLAVGASYPPITVTVNITASAAASVTNIATASGGADASPANNTAADPTTILAAAAPTAITGTASGVGTSMATLNGAVNPNGQSATVQFQYGLTTDYGSTAAIPGSFSGTTTQAVSETLPGLLPGTTYHFRVDATNVLGANAGQDQVFTTLTPIEAWRLQWFGTTANSGPAADNAIATTDGMPNLLKYALGLNPLVATNDPVAGDISTGFLRLTVPKNPQATDVSFYVEVTDDLTAAWTTNGTTVDINTATLLEAHANAPVASSAGAFIRLRVSRP
jgi:uncharacterized repeat protein (TIGR01451 family)